MRPPAFRRRRLPRPADVLGVLGLDAHLLQGQADVPAHVLPLVLGGLVQKAGAVEGGVRGLPLLPGAEQVKVVLRPEVHPQPPLSDVAHRVPQNLPAILGEGLPVLCLQVAVEPGHPAVAGAPGQQGDGVRVGEQEQLPVPGLVKPLDAGGVYGDALFQGPGQHRGQHGDDPLVPEHVAEGEFDELHVVVLDVLLQFRQGNGHKAPAFRAFFS